MSSLRIEEAASTVVGPARSGFRVAAQVETRGFTPSVPAWLLYLTHSTNITEKMNK